MGEMTVPLVDRGNGLWGSSSPAWDHLINRESSGRPTIIQQIHDVNSGGNEAEGLFQITPATWRRNNGTDFAPTARLATPQQQAIVAARIFTRNPTGSDWGAGRPGRENPRELAAGLVPVTAAAPAPQTYGMPTGSNSGGYGNSGVHFPDWVYDLGNAFGLKPSTYPGHQESDRNEGGYAPNPQHLNRGIDWASPGVPDEVDRMQRFADYLFSIRGELEQVIWWNPRTNKRIGVAGGKDVTTTPYYDYPGGYDDHRDHVHTRQSHPIPIPGGATPPPALRPEFTERPMFGSGRSTRSRPPINFFIHTEEGNGTAESLAKFCDGSNNVSYHYTLRDRIVYDVVDTDYYSWSVLSANVFSINLCFAGSFAGWSREQWLAREGDIEIAAYIAVQDCRKYGFPPNVIAPPYHEAPGISDHKYVTQQLHIGDHHDVGDNFPWDVFTRYVNKYATAPMQGDDDLSAEAERMIREMYDEYKKEKKGPSRGFFAPDSNPVDSPLGFLWNLDGNVWNQEVTWGYLFGVKRAEELVNNVAQNGVAPASWAGQLTDAQGHWLAEWGQQWCLGLISFRAAIQKAFKASGAVQQVAVPQATPAINAALSAADVQGIADQTAATVSRQVADQLARQPVPAVPELAPIELASQPEDDAAHVANLLRSLQSLRLADALPIEERAPLAALISILQTKNGSQV